MARERTPLGKRVVIPVRVSEPMRDALDAARGETARSVWVEEAIAERLERQSIPPEEADGIAEWLGSKQLQELAAHAVAMESRAAQPATVTPLRPAKNCKHPKLRTKGVCPDCQTWVPSK